MVWPENWDTVALFWAVRRCWLHRPMGGVMSMNWTQVHSKMAMKGFDAERMAREEARLELMEAAILDLVM